MKPLIFPKELETGNAAIDLEHRQLISWANHLSALNVDADKAVVTKILEDLFVFIHKHFQHEELLMEKMDYPLLNKMKVQHQRLSNEVDALSKQWQSQQDTRAISVALYYLLVDWFFQHILEWDKPLAKAALAAGISEDGASLAELTKNADETP
jgi:hemerythrin-like metal-binding protein